MLPAMTPKTEWTLRELGEELGVDASTLSRHFKRLSHLGVVERCGKQRWRLGVSAKAYKRSLSDETYSKTENGNSGDAAARPDHG